MVMFNPALRYFVLFICIAMIDLFPMIATSQNNIDTQALINKIDRPDARIKEVIDEGISKGLKSIRLNYINEPLIRRDIIKFIKYARDAGILDIFFSTNGSLLTDDVSRDLIKDLESLKGDIVYSYKTIPVVYNSRITKIIFSLTKLSLKDLLKMKNF